MSGWRPKFGSVNVADSGMSFGEEMIWGREWYFRDSVRRVLAVCVWVVRMRQ